MNEFNMEQAVEAYLAIRSERDRLLSEYEEQDAKLKADMAELEKSMLDVCNTVNVDSLKTKHGTIMRKLNERYYCKDWDSFYRFLLDHDAVALLERRIHQTNFREFMSQHEGAGLPDGVDVMREYAISVRKASSK